jgi:hypothetical protein
MVDLSLLQSASYIVGALGVGVAAFYYVMTLRVQQTNMVHTLETRRIALIESVTIRTTNEEGMRSWFELLRYEWKDYEDFERKYGSENNPNAAAKRYGTWATYNSIGSMLRKEMVGAEDLYDIGLVSSVFLWEKFGSIIDEIRRRYMGRYYLRDLEYLAGEMNRVGRQKDPSFKVPETLDKFIPDK